MQYPLPSLSIILPAYNEEEIIEETVSKVLAFGRERGLRFEVIVVNDGSRDRTGAIVKDLCARDPELRLVTHERNRGYGEALRSGFDAAEMDWLFLMDSDGQFDIAELDTLAMHAPKHDMVLGYRAHRADALHRRLYGEGYTLLMNVLFGMRFRDIDCAFKLFRRDAWRAVQPITSTDHKMFTVEWLWHARRAGLSVMELPVPHYPRIKGTQTGARLDVIWQMVVSLLKLRFGRTPTKP